MNHFSRSVFSFLFLLELVLIEFSLGRSGRWVGISNPCLCNEFRCRNGTHCLHKSKICSGFYDCPEGEDELIGHCDLLRGLKTKMSCRKEEFKCKFGGCIKLTEVCNKEVSCWGGVDEASDFCDWVNSP